PRTLVADYQQQAGVRGQTGVDLKRPRANRPLFRVPDTTITGELLEPTHGDPYAPSVLVVKTGGWLNDPYSGKIQVSPGDTLILQVPAPHQQAIQDALSAHPEALILIDNPRESGDKAISTISDKTDLGHIKPVSKLKPEQRRQVPGLSDRALVRVDSNGRVEGQVLIAPAG